VLLGWVKNKAIQRAVLLPLLFVLLARSAIPAGFMLALDSNGHLALTLCSGAGPLLRAGGVGALAHVHHHHHDVPSSNPAGGHPDSSHQADSVCPFAASAGAGPLPSMLVVQQGLSFQAGPVAQSRVFAPGFDLLRAQSARGPPATT
jgi:hypothetical protein